MAKNVNVVPAVVLISFNSKVCVSLNVIRFRLVNFVYTVNIVRYMRILTGFVLYRKT